MSAAVGKDMKICVVRHYPEQFDNRGDLGVKRVGLELAKRLSECHRIMEANIRDPLSWRQVNTFGPEIVHFIIGPSTWGLVSAWLFELHRHGGKTLMSAPNPSIAFGKMGVLFKPDLVLVQSHKSELMFKAMGCGTRFLPNGVDVDRFLPTPRERKMELRKKHGIDEGEFVILHVGPIIKRRNVELLARFQNSKQQVVIIGRMPVDKGLQRRLEQSGCMVLTEYLEHIEEFYALSDCYVFPTPPANKGASIEMPLSILEAMSCNLPVITTRFGALPRAFEEGGGLMFVDAEDDVVQGLERVKTGLETGTRDKVLPYSWANLVEELGVIYEGLVDGTLPTSQPEELEA